MGYYLGIDIGAVSIKVAIIGDKKGSQAWLKGMASHNFLTPVVGDGGSTNHLDTSIFLTEYTRVKGQSLPSALELLRKLTGLLPAGELRAVGVTGSGGRLLAKIIGLDAENEFKAAARGIQELYPHVRTVFEMGGEKSKYILLEADPVSGAFGIADYEASGDCAAGTGSFLDQQAGRLQFSIEEVGAIADSAEKTAKIAGRCSVFAKSDMIHAQQKGYSPAEILKGLCEAVARNFKSSITKGKTVVPQVAFIGGVAANSAVVKALEEAFELKKGSLIIPRFGCWLGAIGTALIQRDRQTLPDASPREMITPVVDDPRLPGLGPAELAVHPVGAGAEANAKSLSDYIAMLENHLRSAQSSFQTTPPLDMERVVLLRDRIPPYDFTGKTLPVPAYLGIDIGSVSTNLVVLDANGDVIKEIYLRTKSRPIEVVNDGLREIQGEIGGRVTIRGVATTGSGRELIGMLTGADMVVDEITAHKTGASYIGDKLLGLKVDTIFEIGGQDSKFISLQDGVVTDFAMNEACAAGTGSFLEERAEELGVSIKDEFSQLALSSRAPIRLGERCTVFMEQDVNACLQKGAALEDVVAGLAYSIGYNYINRVVQKRHIGDVIFFQGGTAYNDSVAAAFSKILEKRIIVPPFNGVMGAVGAALLVKEKVECTNTITGFRGYNLDSIDYTLREFTCKGCTNFCNIQEFRVEEDRVYWGDKCSDRYRKRAKVDKQPVIEDLMGLRHHWLFAGYEEPRGGRTVVGLPRTMYSYDRFQLWNTFFRELGFDVVLSPQTNRKITMDGEDSTIAEPCFPIKVAHGHVKWLIEENVDYLFLPNVIDTETTFPRLSSFLCPWGQTLPFVVKAAPHFQAQAHRFIMPTIHFKDGYEGVLRELVEYFGKTKLRLKKTAIAKALEHGYERQQAFTTQVLEAGRRALASLEESGEIGIVMVGRPYNLYDPGVNLDVPKKLRDFYGVNVIPIDFLPVDEVPVADINDNMFWTYGRKIIAAGKIVKEKPYLHLIYITNFKCGPDSYVKHFIGTASGKPFLVLQFDSHSNDAGMMTRCEAYLDSKGVLRWWNKRPMPAGKQQELATV